MPNKKKKNPTRQQQIKQEILFEIYGIVILSLSLITMASYGAIGRNLTYLSRFIVGTWDFIIPLLGIGLAIYIMVKRDWPKHWSPRLTGCLIMLLALLSFNHFLTFQALEDQGNHGSILDTTWNLLLQERESRLPTDVGSGMVGAIIYALLHFLFDDTGTMIVLGALVLSGFLLVTGFSYVKFFKSMQSRLKKEKKKFKEGLALFLQRNYQQKQKKRKQHGKKKKNPFPNVSLDPIGVQEKPVIYDFEDNASHQADQAAGKKKNKQLTLHLEQKQQPQAAMVSSGKEDESMAVRFQTNTRMSNYRLPSLSLLHKPKKRSHNEKEDIEENADTLVRTLSSFGVQAKVTAIHRGPTVTRYEIQPEIGVKVSRIVNLADDIALALAAKDIRIEAPIPGKSAVGIEVPNAEIAMVGLRDVLESTQYQQETSKLSIALGKDISGEPIVANLAKMPHLLVAGATGSGKSVCINGIISSLLYKARPDEVKLMMIDPKMVELNIYNGIPHLLAPVVTEPRKAAVALKKVVAEMEKRYELFAKNGARDIERYNQIVAEQKEGSLLPLPYIVVIVDELADLMMVAPSDVEDAICRLAQMARAAGIHLIIATQRPSVDVITGVIKANIPSRIAFAVSSQADSRTILDMGGADKLLGRGDMLYLPVGASKPVRIQGAFLSDEEVEAVVKFVKTQQEPEYNEEMIPSAGESPSMEDIHDELYPQAVQLVLEAKTASVSLIQRRLRVGYTRAARLIDLMESNGIVGPYEGSKPREVLITPEQFEENKRVAK
ncbi:DNA translocase FtsK [Paenactinomyces guangxiensis]|uniref:DNA translocase FtsK n=1 Tax=Paenactinomyces guangxiensis TaxID=1490290 RepID=A0A7W1WQU7_9BACL|nr:DNA translocase FtsK [Paenactinomyces guangxiensis]MBA4494394.1 DNA translocase FtsK [Paenactinomyces guangxiensis]MBH8591551.1 DNA translocase FtsK [Paenactinomyces guangxiensis]